ncbi:MAG: hypothetical protein HN757_17850 [Calditrichaeota bacterium]|nr:hypothetical protein [Calditrichota bacterium]
MNNRLIWMLAILLGISKLPIILFAQNWQIEILDDNHDIGNYTSLNLSPEGRPAITIYDATDQILKFAVYEENGWEIEIVDDENNVGQHCTLTIDDVGRPSIAYYDVNRTAVKYAGWVQEEIPDWQINIEEGLDNLSDQYNLALHPDGSQSIAYYDSQNRNLMCGDRIDDQWQIEIIDDQDNVGRFCKLAYDRQDQGNITYYDANRTALKYAGWVHERHQIWDMNILDDDASHVLGTTNSINDKLFVTYLDSDMHSLNVAILSNGTNSVSTVFESESNLEPFGEITTNQFGSIGIVFKNSDQQSLLLAQTDTRTLGLMQPNISDLVVRQMSFPSHQVEILYNLDAPVNQLGIRMLISNNGGQNWIVPVRNVWGDIGENVQIGQNKRIIWNAGIDFPEQVNSEMKIRIIADDGR